MEKFYRYCYIVIFFISLSWWRVLWLQSSVRKRREQSEKLRRKNYEIQTLRDELKTQQVNSVHRRHPADSTRVSISLDCSWFCGIAVRCWTCINQMVMS